MDAFRDVDVEPGSYPLVLFSHGYGGYRLQSSALNVHVASWGYVVVSAEHPERGLMKIMSGDLNIMDRSAETLLELIEFLPEESWIAPHLRADSIAATGHSAGGGAALGVRDDPRIDAVITYGTSSLGSTSISKPSLFIGGTKDRLAGPNQLKSNFEAFPAPKRMTLIEGAGHLAFSDICLIGREEGGVLELASQYGIEVPPVLKILGTDGCKPDDLPAEEAWPQIHHLTVHHLRETWGDPVEAISEDGLRECFGPLLHAYLNEDTDS
jgi:predicted dienelactone hydrolase